MFQDKFRIRESVQWLSSDLSYRKQFVLINDASSSVFCLNAGVPQGSVLGPILYVLCMLPIPDIN